MSTFLAANNAGTTLASTLSSVATTMAVATGTGANFPNPNPALGQYFSMTLIPQTSTTGLPNEIVWVTQVTGDTMTIVRGQEGTTPLSWNVGDLAQNLWTAGQAESLVQVAQAQAQTWNYGLDTGSANAGVVALNPPVLSAALTGIPIRVLKMGAANTGNYTLTVNRIGPIPVLLPGGAQVPSGTLPAGGIFQVIYDGATFELMGAGSQAFTAATALQIWAGILNTVGLSPAGLVAASAPQVLTDASTVVYNAADGYNASLALTAAVGSTRLIDAPTGTWPGETGVLTLTQPLSGGPCRATFSSGWDFLLAGNPTLSTSGGIRDMISWYADPTTGKIIGIFNPG